MCEISFILTTFLPVPPPAKTEDLPEIQREEAGVSLLTRHSSLKMRDTLRSVWLVLLITIQFSGGETERCYKGGEAGRRVRDWISSSMESCRTGGDCEVSQYHDILLNRRGSWYVTSGWNVTLASARPRVEAYQGAFYYWTGGGGGEGGGEGDGEGVYIYPDWTHCVQGRWRRHLLEEGQYCTLTEVCLSDRNTLTVSTRVTHDTKLTYSPPSYSSFGLPPTLMDPFENNSVIVRQSHIQGADEGLFTTRDIGKGEVISFMSGFINNCDYLVMPLDRRNLERTLADNMQIKK